jgi:hypothetical protein
MRMISLKTLAVAMAVVLGSAFQAQALTIDANALPGACGTALCLELSGDDTSQAAIDAAIAGIVGTEVYKSNVGGLEEGSAAAWYTTTYSNTPSDPSDALIEWDGPGVIGGSPIHLLVKDGKQSPAWYLFNISNWNGTDDIVLLNFWAGTSGAISHVSIYGGTTTVPDGGSVALLLGMALMGLAGFRRMMN